MINLNPIIIEEGILDIEDVLINFDIPNSCSENSVRIYHDKPNNILSLINFSVYYPNLDLEYPIYNVDNINNSYLLNGYNNFIIRVRTSPGDFNLLTDIEYNLHIYIETDCNIDPNHIIFCLPLHIQTDLNLELSLLQPETDNNNNNAKLGIKGNGGKEKYTFNLYLIDELNSNNIILIKTFNNVSANELKQVINLVPGLYEAEMIDYNGRTIKKTLRILPFNSSLFNLTPVAKSYSCNYYTNFYHVSDENINDGIIRFNLENGFNFNYTFYWNGPYNTQGNNLPSYESSTNLYTNIVTQTINIGNQTYNRGDLINIEKGWYKFTFVYNTNSEVRWVEVKSPPKTIVNITSYNPPSIPQGMDGNLEIQILSYPENNGDYDLTWYDNGIEIGFPNPYYDEYDNIDKKRIIRWNNLLAGIYELKVKDCLNKIIENLSINLVDPDILSVSIHSIEDSCSCEIPNGKIYLKFDKGNVPIKIKVKTDYTETIEHLITSINVFPYYYEINGLDSGIYELEIIDSIDNLNLSQSVILGGIKVKKPKSILFTYDIQPSYCGLNNGKIELIDESLSCDCLPNPSLELGYALKFEWNGPSITNTNKYLKNQNGLLPGNYEVIISPMNNFICVDNQVLNIEVLYEEPLLINAVLTNVENYGNPEGSINLNIILKEGIEIKKIKWVFENLNGTNYCPDLSLYLNKRNIDCLYAGKWIFIIETNYCEVSGYSIISEPIKLDVQLVNNLSVLNQDWDCETGKLVFRVDSFNPGLLNWRLKGYNLQPEKEDDFNEIEIDREYDQLINDIQIVNLSYPYYIIDNLRSGIWEVLVEDSSNQHLLFNIEIKANQNPCSNLSNYNLEILDIGFYPNPKQYDIYYGDYNLSINRKNYAVYCETTSCCDGLDFILVMDTPISLGFEFDINKFNDINYLKNDKKYLYEVYNKNGSIERRKVRIDGSVIKDGEEFVIPIKSTKCINLEPNNYSNLVIFKVFGCLKNEIAKKEFTYQSLINVDQASCCKVDEGKNREYKISLREITNLAGHNITFLYDEDIEGYLIFNFEYLNNNTCECCEDLIHIDIFKDEVCELTDGKLKFGKTQILELLNNEVYLDITLDKFYVPFKYLAGSNPTDKWVNFKLRTKIKCTGETDWECEIPLCPYVYDTIDINLILECNEGIQIEEYNNNLIEFNNLTPYDYSNSDSGLVIIHLDFPIIPASIQIKPIEESVVNKQWIILNDSYKLLNKNLGELYSNNLQLNLETNNSRRTDYFNGTNLFYFYFDNINKGIVPYLKINNLFNNISEKNDFYCYLTCPVELINGPLEVTLKSINHNYSLNPSYDGSITINIKGGIPPYWVKLVKTTYTDLGEQTYDSWISLPYTKEGIKFNDDEVEVDGNMNKLFNEVNGLSSGFDYTITNLRGKNWTGLDYSNVYHGKWTQSDWREERYSIIVWDSSDMETDLGKRLDMGSGGRLYSVIPFIEMWDLSSKLLVNGFPNGSAPNVGIVSGSYTDLSGMNENKVRITIQDIPSGATNLKLVITNNNILNTLDINNQPVPMCNIITGEVVGSDLNDFKNQFLSNNDNFIVKNIGINKWESNNDFPNLNFFNFDLDKLQFCDCLGYYKVDFTYDWMSKSYFISGKFKISEKDYFTLRGLNYDSLNKMLIVDFSNSRLLDLVGNSDNVGLSIYIKNETTNWSKSYTMNIGKKNPIIKLSGVNWDGTYYMNISIISNQHKLKPNQNKTILCKKDYKDAQEVRFLIDNYNVILLN